MANIDTRSVTLVDIPLIRRLSERGTVLNSELGLTRDARTDNSALLSSILFARGLCTLITRSDGQQVIGQFRYKQDEPNAHIVYMAPDLDADLDDTAWLHLLDAMTHEAGKHGAHTLIAEVTDNSVLFETMRNAGFAVYARQVIWRHDPWNGTQAETVQVTEETPDDHIGILSLLYSTTPPMVQQVTAPNSDMRGWVYRKNGRIEGYVALAEGKDGIYVQPYLHPDIMSEAADVLSAVMKCAGNARKVPIYVGVRVYQNWLDSTLYDLGFEPGVNQAVMVRHIAAGIRYPIFSRVEPAGKWERVHSPMPPPSSQIIDEQLN